MASGPMAEVLAQAGFSSEHIRRVGEVFRLNFCEPGAIGMGVMQDADARRFVNSFRDKALAMERQAMGQDAWTIEVDITDRVITGWPFLAGEFRVETTTWEILATSEHEAVLAASQIVASIRDPLCTGELMIVATRVIDWPDTLTTDKEQPWASPSSARASASASTSTRSASTAPTAAATASRATRMATSST